MAPIRYHDGGFPPKEIDWSKLIPLIGPARGALERYDALLGTMPNPQVLLSPLTTQEAVLSSRIEGTQATMGEVLEYEAGAGPDERVQPEKVDDIREILNYRRAIHDAEQALDELPLSGRLIRRAHEILMEGVRGRNKAPGEYRRHQNWIGTPGCTEEEARFVPIAPQHLQDGMAALERYIHSDEPDTLVQLAIIHAEFESLHPFMDGNGRLGRMLIPLFLYYRKLLSRPTFYLSAYLESRREEYYDRLLAISRDGDWTAWCAFFLQALINEASTNTRKAKAILDLYERKKIWIAEHTRSQHAIRAVDFIFDRPVFKTTDFVASAGIPAPTAKRMVYGLRDEGLLVPLREASGSRPAILAFSELLNIAEGRDAF